MPSTITHAYFSMDLYDRFDQQKQKALKPYINQFKVFAQGPDPLFFYNIVCPKKGKEVRNLGHYMHQNETQLFFTNLITTIKDKKLENDPEVIAFLYGFIAHYVLDMTTHPFVIYKVGIFDKHIKSSRRYFGGHELMEVYIDAYFMKVRGKTLPKDFDVANFCFKETSMSNTLKELINVVFNLTFKQKGMGTEYIKSVKQMKCFYNLFRIDHFGIKRIIYKLSQIFPFSIRMDALSYHITLDKSDYYLNLNKEPWHHPLDKDEIYNYSFIELYAIALSRTRALIIEVDKALHNKKTRIQLNKLFPNLSYLTGYNCKLGKGKYFSF